MEPITNNDCENLISIYNLLARDNNIEENILLSLHKIINNYKIQRDAMLIPMHSQEITTNNVKNAGIKSMIQNDILNIENNIKNVELNIELLSILFFEINERQNIKENTIYFLDTFFEIITIEKYSNYGFWNFLKIINNNLKDKNECYTLFIQKVFNRINTTNSEHLLQFIKIFNDDDVDKEIFRCFIDENNNINLINATTRFFDYFMHMFDRYSDRKRLYNLYTLILNSIGYVEFDNNDKELLDYIEKGCNLPQRIMI